MPPRFVVLRLFIFGMTLVAQAAMAEPAKVYLNQLAQDYNGEPRFPNISTDPPGLGVEVSIIPRSSSEVVYQTIPAIPQPSYVSYGIGSTTNKAFGDEVNLGGSNRILESLDFAMVTFAKAADWPLEALANPEGYLHPLTAIVYKVEGETLTLVDQKTQEVLIPWRPATVDDGGEFPFDGLGFNVRFDFNERVPLTGKILVMIAYNTELSGFQPIGLPGPYNTLNVALGDSAPLVGTDSDSTKMIRYLAGISRSSALGALAPLFTVRTFSANPPAGTPLDAGGYLVSASIAEAGFEGEGVANFEVLPLEAEVTLSGLRQVADGTPKTVSVVTDPSGLAADVIFSRRTTLPDERGLYPVFATLVPGNYVGKASGTMRLGYSYESWIAEKVAGGSIPPESAGKSDDPDFDGRDNFLEYLASSDPGVATSEQASSLEISRSPDGVRLEFSRNNEAIDVYYELQRTTNLSDPGSWTAVPIPAEATLPFVASEHLKVISPFKPAVPSEFFRLQLTAP
ncbi:MBG domain-containing protein [Verrucomicrobiaceae bacterium 227]